MEFIAALTLIFGLIYLALIGVVYCVEYDGFFRPGGVDQPWKNIDISNLKIEKGRNKLRVSVDLKRNSRARVRCMSYYNRNDLHFMLQQSEPPVINEFLFTFTNESGGYEQELKLKPNTKRIFFGQELLVKSADSKCLVLEQTN